MNRNYKVIWNDALNCFTAVAEYAKTGGKSSNASVVSSPTNSSRNIIVKTIPSWRLSALRLGVLAAGATSLMLGLSAPAAAAVGVDGGVGDGTAISACTGVNNAANSGLNSDTDANAIALYNVAIGCATSTETTQIKIADRGNPNYTGDDYAPSGRISGAVAIGTGANSNVDLGLAVGQYATTTGISGVSIGTGTLASGNTAIAIGRQSVASGNFSQAMGNVASATGEGALAMGHSSSATGSGSIAIGATDIRDQMGSGTPGSAQAGTDYNPVGQTRATARNTIALGRGAASTLEGAVALGSGSTTETSANAVTEATVGNNTYSGFAGATNIEAGDQISVGASGQERQIKNVAAGNVTQDSTDAINGSQLYSVAETLDENITTNTTSINNNTSAITTNTTNISNNTTAINSGINFGNGDTNNNFALGDTISVTGDDNITSVTTDEGVQVQLNRDLALNSVTTGNTLVNNEGITLTGGSNRTVRLTNNGLDNGGNRIINVANGVDDNDAVNVSQLNAVRDSAETANRGFDISAQGSNVSTVAPGDSVDLNNQDGNIVVSKTADNNDVSFDLNQNVNLESATFGDVVISADGLDNGGNQITNVANGTVAQGSSDAITGDQLNSTADSITTVIGGNAVNNGGIITTTDIGGTGQDTIDGAISSIQQGAADTNEAVSNNTTNIANNTTNITNNTNRLDGGLNFGADSGNTINKPIGDGSVLRFEGDSNITTTTENSSIRFSLNENINVESVTTNRLVAGNTTVNNNGVTITGGNNQDVRLTNNGLDNGGNRITNVADAVNVNDAVNLGQLNSIDRQVNGRIERLDKDINDLGYRVDDVEDDANAGISAAMAMSSLPQAYLPGKSMVGGGIASYNGEGAVAIGVSRVSDNGRWVMKINGTADTQGNAGGAIGAGFHF